MLFQLLADGPSLDQRTLDQFLPVRRLGIGIEDQAQYRIRGIVRYFDHQTQSLGTLFPGNLLHRFLSGVFPESGGKDRIFMDEAPDGYVAQKAADGPLQLLIHQLLRDDHNLPVAVPAEKLRGQSQGVPRLQQYVMKRIASPLPTDCLQPEGYPPLRQDHHGPGYGFLPGRFFPDFFLGQFKRTGKVHGRPDIGEQPEGAVDYGYCVRNRLSRLHQGFIRLLDAVQIPVCPVQYIVFVQEQNPCCDDQESDHSFSSGTWIPSISFCRYSSAACRESCVPVEIRWLRTYGATAWMSSGTT